MKTLPLKENHLYKKAYKSGKNHVGRQIAVYVMKDYTAERLKKENPLKMYVNRLGVTVSKKNGGAVSRNRTKRIIRAAYFSLEDKLKRGFIIVISARAASGGKKSTDIQKELEKAFQMLGMLAENREADTVTK